ncbi:bacterioferritin [Shewanella sp. NFH-SH190041]|uniref:bacterioferritin n=1 Tax=Shewanella sp. NFH-SH190041 TaxID=2950245 RepID=UPI0021C432EF|nr:bacterioferritin [Shewanella sp. NFH-SH190041]BDM63358.1 bacterioferritin [Shewanella sp. NFH-SH190041]
MKGHPSVIGQLNQILTCELTAINQYFLHARMFRNWGFEQLNSAEYKKSIQDMKHADKLIERVLFLEGLPNLQQLDKIHIGEHPAEMLGCDKSQITQQIVVLKEAIQHCESMQDYVSRDLLNDLLEDEEAHLDWLEAQFELIEMTGIENYLQRQI